MATHLRPRERDALDKARLQWEYDKAAIKNRIAEAAIAGQVAELEAALREYREHLDKKQE